MDTVLDLNKTLAKRNFNELSQKLFVRNDINYILDKSVSVKQAASIHQNDCISTVVMGIAEIEHVKKPGLFKQGSVNDSDFVNVILNMYHEYCHCVQKNSLYKSLDLEESDINQLIQDVACVGNHEYYKGAGNYYINASEIQAEIFGIMNTYQYLCDEFPDLDKSECEALVLDVVNDKVLNNTYFVKSDKPFTSLSDVETAFDEAYDKSFETKRIYYVESRNTSDPVKRFMQSHVDSKEAYLSAATPLEQDRCVASINLYLQPKLYESRPILKEIDLGYNKGVRKSSRQQRVDLISNKFSDILDADKQDKRSDFEY